MIDLVTSTLPHPMDGADIMRFKREAFLAILNEEQDRLTADPALVSNIRFEVMERMSVGD